MCQLVCERLRTLHLRPVAGDPDTAHVVGAVTVAGVGELSVLDGVADTFGDRDQVPVHVTRIVAEKAGADFGQIFAVGL